MIDPHQYCRNFTNSNRSSFFYSFLFLSPLKRQAMNALYAFCREVADIPNKCSDPSITATKIAWWRNDVTQIFEGRPQHPVNLALQSLRPHFDLKQTLMDKVITGIEMDQTLTDYETFEDFILHCEHGACAIGMMATEVLGYHKKQSLDFSRNLGIGFQIVHNIRSIGENIRKGRLYLPKEDLTRFKLTTSEILNDEMKSPDNLKGLLKFHADRARSYYKVALDVLPECDRYLQHCALIMAKLYFTLLDEIEACEFDVMHQKIMLPPTRKLWLAWRTLRREKKLYRNLKASVS